MGINKYVSDEIGAISLLKIKRKFDSVNLIK